MPEHGSNQQGDWRKAWRAARRLSPERQLQIATALLMERWIEDGQEPSGRGRSQAAAAMLCGLMQYVSIAIDTEQPDGDAMIEAAQATLALRNADEAKLVLQDLAREQTALNDAGAAVHERWARVAHFGRHPHSDGRWQDN